MPKNQILFLAAVASAVVMTGCSTPIMEPRPVVTATPANTPAAKNEYAPVEPAISAPANELPAPRTQPQRAYQTYAPMTDVVSSGGVDSAPRRAVKRSGKKASGKGAVAAGGVYIVKRGDSPERIARRLKVRVSDLMKANNLTEATARRIQIGQKLVIPGKKYSAAAPAKKSVRKADKASSASAGSTALTDGKYTVKRGDSPERIARRFKIKVAELMKANNLTEATARRIQIGQKLVIPGSGSAVQAKKAAVESAAPAAAASGEVTDVASAVTSEATVSDSTVSDGTVSDAAAPAAAPASAPAAAAPAAAAPAAAANVVGDDSSSISGVEYTGEAKPVAEVAAMYGVSVEEFLKLNGDKRDAKVISRGDWIILPGNKSPAVK